MSVERNLIVNADDLGLSAAINAGILRAHEDGIVTSASLMVRQPAARAAVALAASAPSLALGLHLDLAQWDYRDDDWHPAYLRCDTGDEAAVREECRSQLDAFRALVGRDPTHLDSHQHVHDSEPVASVAAAIAGELGVPLRGRSIRFDGAFYGQTGYGSPSPDNLSPRRLAEMVAELPEGWTEFGCHPGIGVVVSESTYARERELEVGALCDAGVARALREAGVTLRSFADAARDDR